MVTPSCIAFSALIFAAGFRLSLSQDVLVKAQTTVKVLPDDDGDINSNTFLACFITPFRNETDNLTTWWILPGGITLGARNNTIRRFAITQGSISLDKGQTVYGTVLLVLNVSYADAGLYQCVVTMKESTASLASTTMELQLRVTVQIWEHKVRVLDNETSATLSCEMRGFLRPDERLQWWRKEQLITSGEATRHYITYHDGAVHTSQNGRSFTVPGRVSTLTIMNPTERDSDTYVCQLQGTMDRAETKLIVVHFESTPFLTPMPPCQDTAAPDFTDCTNDTALAVTLTFLSTVLITVLMMCGIMLCCHHLQSSQLSGGAKARAHSAELVTYGDSQSVDDGILGNGT